MSTSEGNTCRKEHLDWCKQRAMEFCMEGNLSEAFMSFCSDMSKHNATADHPFLATGQGLFFGGHLNTPKAMQDFIEGFN